RFHESIVHSPPSESGCRVEETCFSGNEEGEQEDLQMVRVNPGQVRRGLLLVGAAVLLAAAGGEGPNARQMIVRGPFVAPAGSAELAANRVVVKFDPMLTPEQIDATFGPLGAHWLETGVDDAFVVLNVAPGTVRSWVTLLKGSPGVAYAEADPIAWMT